MISAQLRHVAKVAKQRGALRVGLTGGIASGKTLVAAMFEVLGAPVAFADSMARGLMERPGPVRTTLERLLGADAYLPNGSLDRAQLGARLFADAQLLEQVNAIVHPAVRKAAEEWHRMASMGASYTVYESALLFESGAYRDFDAVVTVHAPLPLRLARAVERDGTDEESVRARMAAQLSDHERLAHDSYIILNDGSRSLIRQVHEFHVMLRSAAKI